MPRTQPNSLGNRLRTLVTAEGSRELVAAFYNPRETFAGSLFDTQGDNTPDQFLPEDLLALTLLDVRLAPRAVRAIIEPGEVKSTLEDLLSAIPLDVALWEATDSDLESAQDLWTAISKRTGSDVLSGIGPTKRSKLLARKRPQLVPIIDSVILSALHPLLGDNSWRSLREALQEDDLRDESKASDPATRYG